MFATGFVDDAPRNTVPSVSEPLLQLVSAVFQFCVMSEKGKRIWKGCHVIF